MSTVAFECGGCGKAFQVDAALAGKIGRCKQCGAMITVPSAPDPSAPRLASAARTRPVASAARTPPVVDPYGLDEDDARPARPAPGRVAAIDDEDDEVQQAEAAESVLPARSRSNATAAAKPTPAAPKKKKKKKAAGRSGGGFAIPWREIGGGIGTVFVVLIFVFRVARIGRVFIPRGGGNAAVAAAPDTPRAATVRDVGRFQSGPIALPRFPDLGPGREVESGIALHEVVFGPTDPPVGTPPGHGGKLWVYLPSGKPADGSLPCILIAGAGSNLVSGMTLGEGDRPEHLPYARAGFAVVAFEIDGDDEDEEEVEAASRFLAARAGVTNAHIALEYALAKVPAVDPARVTIAGHSSAGTLAVLFAENEPRLRSAVAYAPALDLEQRFGPEGLAALRSIGAADLATRYSPKNNVDGLSCPLFLVHARDDSNVPVAMTEAFAAQAKGAGKAVTLDLVPTGDHYQAMLGQGIPHAIAWLKGEAAPAR